MHLVIILFFIFDSNYLPVDEKKVLLNEKNLPLTGIIIANLLLFFYIPAELSYLQPCIIILYYFDSKFE